MLRTQAEEEEQQEEVEAAVSAAHVHLQALEEEDAVSVEEEEEEREEEYGGDTFEDVSGFPVSGMPSSSSRTKEGAEPEQGQGEEQLEAVDPRQVSFADIPDELLGRMTTQAQAAAAHDSSGQGQGQPEGSPDRSSGARSPGWHKRTPLG